MIEPQESITDEVHAAELRCDYAKRDPLEGGSKASIFLLEGVERVAALELPLEWITGKSSCESLSMRST